MKINLSKRKAAIRLAAACAVGLAGAAAMPGSAWAASGHYPDRPIRLIVGYSAGGPTDVLARLLAKEMATNLGGSIVVENKPGANGYIATEYVQRAAPDGYTILMNTISHNVNPLIKPHLIHYDPIKDFTQIAQVAVLPQLLVVGGHSPYESLKQLLDKAKKQPGQVSFGSAGVGGSAHLAAALLEERSGTKMNHIPFQGNGPALTDVMAGRVDFMFYPMVGLKDFVSSGKLRILAATTAKRLPDYPKVPTMSELGFPGFEDYAQPIGFVGPAHIPEAITAKLANSVKTVLDKPEVQERLKTLGAEIKYRDSKDYREWLGQDRQRWADLIKKADIRAE
ncbi:tripartite tricarboxylate transporter substrate binding protein [Candidimonas humi]|uniref:Bug family tripartite tricarboxylate transporter substrate binding protein n=1 Tax=Candidimonas humi TaxID=683355 RepID=A0ABV8NYS1_9BURK|nr:tripartite tricarboxylate transporter substrate binding protein [Candidimonas humi]MBV6306961.1 tripartite tricarboxylate transporter substrate binding protein [Candidimonas humi]